MDQSVDAILMASGSSVRFGAEDKLLAPFRGTPLVLHTVRLALQAGCFRHIFLVYARPEVAALAEGLAVCAIYNGNPGRGMCESVRLGVQASRAAHYLFFPCDQPLLPAEVVRSIVEQRRSGRIVVPSNGLAPGTPVLVSATFREELLSLADGETPRLLKKRHPEAVYTLRVASRRALMDVDTVEALNCLQAKDAEEQS